MTAISRSAPKRYSAFARSLHWATVVLVLIAFIVSVGGPENRVYSVANDFDRSLHELLGVAVFTITLIRLLWRVFDPPPPSPMLVPWMERTSKIVQGTLYILLLLVPVTAISGAWLEGHPLTLLGIGSIDPMIRESRQIGIALASFHGLIGDALIWLAGLHASAAIYHHVWLKDDVLRSMLPSAGRRQYDSN